MEKIVKIGIDAMRYKAEQPTGVEWYSYYLLNQLLPMMGRDHHKEFMLYTKPGTEFKEELPFNVKQVNIPYVKIWTMLRFSLEMIFKPVNTFFVPSHVFPLIIPKKAIITIHDVAFKEPKLASSYTNKQRFMMDFHTKRAVRKAYKIIVPSQATKDDLIKYYNCPEDKIKVIYHGGPDVSGDKNPAILKWNSEEKKKILDKMGLKEEQLIILYVGRIETKKNLVNLVTAFKRFSLEFPGWKLVLAGKNGVGHEQILNKINELELQESVILTGYITENEKRFLLDKCRIFAFPSLYEGFGLPILEAFAFRRPVLTSKTSSMPEIAGKAAFLADPEKVEELSVGLKRLASDGMYISRLIREGEEQLKKFSWEKTAKETAEIVFE